MKSTLSSKGKITVLIEIREQLGISGKHPVDRVFGRLHLDRPVDTLLDEMRGPRPSVSRSAFS